MPTKFSLLFFSFLLSLFTFSVNKCKVGGIFYLVAEETNIDTVNAETLVTYKTLLAHY